MKTSKDWVVWCRIKKKGNEELEQLLSEDGREVFQGKCGGGEAKGEDESEEKETRKGRTKKSRDGGGGATWGRIRMQET